MRALLCKPRLYEILRRPERTLDTKTMGCQIKRGDVRVIVSFKFRFVYGLHQYRVSHSALPWCFHFRIPPRQWIRAATIVKEALSPVCTYDALNRKARASYADGSVTFAYDADSRLTRVDDTADPHRLSRAHMTRWTDSSPKPRASRP